MFSTVWSQGFLCLEKPLEAKAPFSVKSLPIYFMEQSLKVCVWRGDGSGPGWKGDSPAPISPPPPAPHRAARKVPCLQTILVVVTRGAGVWCATDTWWGRGEGCSKA